MIISFKVIKDILESSSIIQFHRSNNNTIFMQTNNIKKFISKPYYILSFFGIDTNFLPNSILPTFYATCSAILIGTLGVVAYNRYNTALATVIPTDYSKIKKIVNDKNTFIKKEGNLVDMTQEIQNLQQVTNNNNSSVVDTVTNVLHTNNELLPPIDDMVYSAIDVSSSLIFTKPELVTSGLRLAYKIQPTCLEISSVIKTIVLTS
jgi:hypothetical protein